MPDLILPRPVAQALLDYIAARPYREVYQLVAALQSLQETDSEEVDR